MHEDVPTNYIGSFPVYKEKGIWKKMDVYADGKGGFYVLSLTASNPTSVEVNEKRRGSHSVGREFEMQRIAQ